MAVLRPSEILSLVANVLRRNNRLLIRADIDIIKHRPRLRPQLEPAIRMMAGAAGRSAMDGRLNDRAESSTWQASHNALRPRSSPPPSD